MIQFYVPGAAKPQGSKRAFVVGGRARLVESAGAALRSWRVDVATVAAQHCSAPIEGPVRVRLDFSFARPASVSAKKRPHPSVKPDVDKLARAALDAMTGIAWHDDAQVVWLEAVKVYGAPGTTIAIEEVR